MWNTDVELLVCEVDIVIVQQLPLPRGGEEGEGGGQGAEEGHPGQQEAVAIQQGVSLRHPHDCAEKQSTVNITHIQDSNSHIAHDFYWHSRRTRPCLHIF